MSESFDVAIIGGGPAGASAALLASRAGLRAVLLEKSAFPRFQIGESLLPLTWRLLEQWGLIEGMKRVPHVPKYGAEFGFGDGLDTSVYLFDNPLVGGPARACNVARADFDAYLLDSARAAGADIRQPCAVRAIEQLDEGGARLATDAGPLDARWLLDASGQATVVARHLNTRVTMPDRHLRKVAYFEHFQDVRRLEGRYEGCPTIAMADEGWFWIIPLNERMTSVGLVLDPDVARSIDVPARRLLRWGIERCPLMRQRLRDAVGPEDNLVRADFSYRCDPMAGPGYFLLGDAAMFIDPIFSTGVSIGMAAAQGAVQAILDIRQSRRRPSAARHRYIRLMRGLCAPLLRLIHHYYDHAFRELFLNGRGPLRLHQAVMAVLAGNVLPRVAPAVAWRLEVFNQVVRLQRRFALAPRRRRFSLLRSPVDAVPGLASIRLKAGRMDTPVSLAG